MSILICQFDRLTVRHMPQMKAEFGNKMVAFKPRVHTAPRNYHMNTSTSAGRQRRPRDQMMGAPTIISRRHDRISRDCSPTAEHMTVPARRLQTRSRRQPQAISSSRKKNSERTLSYTWSQPISAARHNRSPPAVVHKSRYRTRHV